MVEGKLLKRERTGKNQYSILVEVPGYRYREKFRRRNQCYNMENKHFNSNVGFELKNGNGDLVSFNGQSKLFRRSIRGVQFQINDKSNTKITL